MLYSSVNAKTVKLTEELKKAEKRELRLQTELDQCIDFKKKLEVFLKVQSLPLPELLTTVQLALTRKDHSVKQDISEQYVISLERKIIELTNEVNFLKNQPQPSPDHVCDPIAIRDAQKAATSAQQIARTREMRLQSLEKEFREYRLKMGDIQDQNRLLRNRVKYLETQLVKKQNNDLKSDTLVKQEETKSEVIPNQKSSEDEAVADIKDEKTIEHIALEQTATVENIPPSSEPVQLLEEAQKEQKLEIAEAQQVDSVVPLNEE